MTTHADRRSRTVRKGATASAGWADVEPTRTILDAAKDAFVSIDARGTILAWNRAAREMFGWTSEEACGHSMADLIMPERYREAHLRGLERFLETSETRVTGRRLEVHGLHRDGREIPIELAISPAWVGKEPVFNSFVRDITERRTAEEGLRRLAAIVETSSDAIVSGSLDGTVESWNSGAERLYGYTAEEMIGQSIDRLLPSGDLSEMAPINERLSQGYPVRDLETREVRKDGSLFDASVSLSPLAGESGEMVGVASITRDVTERREAERALAEARERFQEAFESAPIGMGLVDLQGRFMSVNRSFCDFLGRSSEELTALTFEAITHPDDVEPDHRQVERMLTGEIERYELEKRYVRPDGELRWGLLCVSLVRDSEGGPLHFIRQVQDITARREAEEELRRQSEQLKELALRDPLTRLPNDRDFHAALDRELARVDRQGAPLSIVIVDIDHFTRLNEARGHREGDRALRDVALAMQRVCRASDLAARVGPDEFALILPATDAAGAEAAVLRVCDDLRERVSISYGVASRGAYGDAKAPLLLRAEQALNAARAPAEDREGQPDLPPAVLERVERILSHARGQLGVESTFLAEFAGDREVLRALSAETSTFGLERGTELPLSESYCHRMMDGRIPNVVPDSHAEPHVAELAVTRERGIGAYAGVPVRRPDGTLYGALCAVSDRPRPDLDEGSTELLRFVAGLIGEVLDQMSTDAREHRIELELSGIHALLSALEARDSYTGEHSRTVVRLAVAVAEQMELPRETVLTAERVALLHDIGKVGIPDAILQKRGALTDGEWDLMREHPAVGERILAGTDSLSYLAPAVRAEHERFDGDGYPDGLRGEQIPIEARIALACDAYNAMTTERPYRAAMTEPEARAELRANAGTQFDPTVVEALQAILGEDPSPRDTSPGGD